MEFTVQELWESTGLPVRVVIAIMAVMAIWCVYIAVERLITLQRGRGQSRRLAEAVGAQFVRNDSRGALNAAKDQQFKASYLGHMLVAGLTEFAARPDRHGIEAVERAIERTSITEGAELRKGLNILATTGATAPFVGLVGTIFGIINAFRGMAESGSGGLGSVSAGIAEALVTTAIGISVAIMGVWMFNFFNGRIEAISNDISVSAQELLDWCEKQILPPAEEAGR